MKLILARLASIKLSDHVLVRFFFELIGLIDCRVSRVREEVVRGLKVVVEDLSYLVLAVVLGSVIEGEIAAVKFRALFFLYFGLDSSYWLCLLPWQRTVLFFHLN